MGQLTPVAAGPPQDAERGADEATATDSTALMSSETPSKPSLNEIVDEARYHAIYGRVAQQQLALERAEQIGHGQCAAVHWMRGQVQLGQQWLTPEEVAEATRNDLQHMQYLELREKSTDDFAGNQALASWCRVRGMDDQMLAHLERCLWFEPDNASVRNALGHRQVNGVWVTPAQMRQEALELAVTQHRLEAWRQPVGQLLIRYSEGDAAERTEVLGEISELSEPTVIPALELLVAPCDQRLALAAVRRLAGICRGRGNAGVDANRPRLTLAPSSWVGD